MHTQNYCLWQLMRPVFIDLLNVTVSALSRAISLIPCLRERLYRPHRAPKSLIYSMAVAVPVAS